MTLDELKKRLDIPLTDTSKDEKLSMDLEDAIDFAKKWCNNTFINEAGVLELPQAVKKGIAVMIDIDINIPVGVQSESIAGMSQAFNINERYESVFKLWRPFKKVRFING